MDATVFLALALACAPQVHADTARALVSVESAFNPWAIGVVGGALVRQPRHRAEALATAKALQAAGWNFSVGLGADQRGQLRAARPDVESAFEPCANLAAMQTVLAECFDRASGSPSKAVDQVALRQALSCYYSGNFATGFRHGYVRKVVVAATRRSPPPHRRRSYENPRIDPARGAGSGRHRPGLAVAAAIAQGFDKINTTVTNVNTILVTISIAVVTIAIIWAGFKMIFQGARLADVANVLIGGTLVGGAAAFASYIVN